MVSAVVLFAAVCIWSSTSASVFAHPRFNQEIASVDNLSEENFVNEPEIAPFRLQTGLKQCYHYYCCPTDTTCCSNQVGFVNSNGYCCKGKITLLGWPC